MKSPDYFRFSFQSAEENYSGKLADVLMKYAEKLPAINKETCGIYLATATAGMEESVEFWRNTLKQTPAFVNPANFPFTLSNAPASCIAKALGVKGPVYTMVGGKSALSACMLNAALDMETDLVEVAFIIGFDRLGSEIHIAGVMIDKKQLEYIPLLQKRIEDAVEEHPSMLMNALLNKISEIFPVVTA
jgi:hypothetical protein